MTGTDLLGGWTSTSPVSQLSESGQGIMGAKAGKVYKSRAREGSAASAVMTTLKDGWLHKKSSGIFPQWQHRMVELQSTNRGKTLTLKADRNGSKCRQFIIDRAERGTAENIVVVHCSGGRVLQLRAKTKADRDEWIGYCQAQASTSQTQPTEISTKAPRSRVGADAEFSSKFSPSLAPDADATNFVQAASTGQTSVALDGEDIRSQRYPQGKYVGEMKGGERHGIGRLQYDNGNLYVGGWEREVKSGFGMLAWTNKDVYHGEWKNDKMWGYGYFCFSNGNSYAGMFVSDNKEGTGKFNWSNGDTYEGEWIKDDMTGQGTTRHSNGNTYSGNHKSNVKDGRGKMEWASGDKFEGEWKNGVIQGKGTFHYADGGHYKGEWVKDKRQGSGTMKHTNGDVYIGCWLNDMRHGNGSCQYQNGDGFVGNFSENMREGFGVYTAAKVRQIKDGNAVSELKGDQYSGNWQKDKKHGFGKYVWSDGDVYEGEWENDLRSNDGTCVYSNGDKYTGEWQNDLRHGWGRLAWADGNTYEGGWKNDNISPGTKGLVQSGKSVGPSRQTSTNPSRDASRTNSPRSQSVVPHRGLAAIPDLQDGVYEDWGDIPDAGEILGGVINGINDWGANALGGIANNVTNKNVLKEPNGKSNLHFF